MDKIGIIFPEPLFKERIWGGDRLKKSFAYQTKGEGIGECWGISAYPDGDCPLRAVYDIEGEEIPCPNMTLGQLWEQDRESFGSYPSPDFPLLVKIIDAKEDLSIQVHPDDEYAGCYRRGERGKTECWLILDCKEGASIIVGHHAKNREELAKMIEEKRWKELIREVPIGKGDFFQIDAGCLHAIRGGTLLLETQQSSDLTFRVYDYDRLSNGKPRELHIEESLDCIRTPYEEERRSLAWKETAFGSRIDYIEGKYYSLYRCRIEREALLGFSSYFTCASVLEGEGRIDRIPIKKGDHFIIANHKKSAKFEGKLEIVFSNPN